MPPLSPRGLLAAALSEGRSQIGEIFVMDGYALRHAADENVGQLKLYTDPRAAREIARYDAEGKYRPLKTAPNLRRGWLLQTGSLEGLEMALEFFYPAALGLWLSWRQGTLAPTSFRETLGRQTGMYRVTQLITEEQSEDLVAHCCRSNGGCLRTILWEIKPGEPVRSLPEDKRTLAELPSDRIPLICREACNLIVAAARPIAKGNLPKTG